MRGFILLLLLVAGPTSVLAQFDPRIRTGVQVRVATSQQRLAIGKVAWIDPDSMVVDRDTAASLRFAVHDITALEVYRQGKDAEATGMVFGTLTAAGAAVVYVKWCVDNPRLCQYLEEDDDSDHHDENDEDDEEPFSMLSLVTLGFGAIGYAIGYALVPPRWEVVNLPLRIGVAPMQRGVGVYVSLPAPRFARAAR